MNRFLGTIAFTLIAMQLNGQALDSEFVRIYIKPSTGTTFALTNLMNGNLSDNLFEFNDKNSYINISGTYFFNKNIGVEINYHGFIGGLHNQKKYAFYNGLEHNYGNDYHITADYRLYNATALLNNSYQRGMIAMVYKLERKNYFLIPKFYCGYTTIPVNTSEVLLKRKNSNEYRRLNFRPSLDKSFYLTLGPGISAGRRIFNHFLLSFDLQYNWFRPNFTYTMKSRDLYTGVTSTETYSYTKNIHSVSIGIGLLIELKYKSIRMD